MPDIDREIDPIPWAGGGARPRSRVRVTRVLVVEDERLLAEMLSDVLEDEPDMRVVGVAGSVAEATAMAALHPDVVLMDYRLPDGTGAMATHAIKARWATARVIMLSAIRDDETMMESIGAGADAYLTKDRAVGEIVAAVRAARSGETLLPREVIAELARRVADSRSRPEEPSHVRALTPRQTEILRELVNGRTTREICGTLGISPNTLRTHLEHVMERLGTHSKLEAVAVALRHGLVEPPRDAVHQAGRTD